MELLFPVCPGRIGKGTPFELGRYSVLMRQKALSGNTNILLAGKYQDNHCTGLRRAKTVRRKKSRVKGEVLYNV